MRAPEITKTVLAVAGRAWARSAGIHSSFAMSLPRWLMMLMSAATAVATVMSINAWLIQGRLHAGRAVKRR